MKNWMWIILFIFELLLVACLYVIKAGANLSDVIVGMLVGFGLGAIFGWVMTSLEKDTHEQS